MKQKTNEAIALQELDKIVTQYDDILGRPNIGKEVVVNGYKTREITDIMIHIDQPLTSIISELSKEYYYDSYEDDYKRIMNCKEDIIYKILEDKYTRQAIISNWHNQVNQCFSQLQFIYRITKNTKNKEALNLIVYFRSCDLIYKFNSDVIFLSHILKKFSNELELDQGHLTLFIASLHRYINNV